MRRQYEYRTACGCTRVERVPVGEPIQDVRLLPLIYPPDAAYVPNEQAARMRVESRTFELYEREVDHEHNVVTYHYRERL